MWPSHLKQQSSKKHTFTFPLAKAAGLPRHLYPYPLLPVLTGVPDQTYFSYFFIKTSHLFDGQPGYPVATDECRNAALLMVMSPVLACLSQEGCEFQFGQTKASITETPRGDFQSSFCALLQHSVCPSCNLTGPTFSALFKLVTLYFFIPYSWKRCLLYLISSAPLQGQ